MNVIRTVLTYIIAGIVMVAALPYLAYMKHKEKKIGMVLAMERINGLTSMYAKVVLFFAGAKIEVSGTEHIPQDQTVLFAGNHQSNFDIPVAVGYIPRAKGFIAKQELGEVPVISIWIKGLHSALIARGEGRKALEAIGIASKHLKEGYSMVVFPEGTRSKDGNLLEFKAGSLRPAAKAGVAIVPFAIDGSKNVMPRGSKILKKGTIKLTILPAIPAEDVKNADTTQLAYQVKSSIAHALGQEIDPIME